MLDKRQLSVCELIATGIPITEVAELTDVARSTIYEWKKLEEFKAELDRFGREFIFSTQQAVISYGPTVVAELKKLAKNAKSEKVRLDALSKLLDKTMSNATKIEVTDGREDKDNVTIDVLDQEIKEFDGE